MNIFSISALYNHTVRNDNKIILLPITKANDQGHLCWCLSRFHTCLPLFKLYAHQQKQHFQLHGLRLVFNCPCRWVSFPSSNTKWGWSLTEDFLSQCAVKRIMVSLCIYHKFKRYFSLFNNLQVSAFWYRIASQPCAGKVRVGRVHTSFPDLQRDLKQYLKYEFVLSTCEPPLQVHNWPENIPGEQKLS